MSHQTKLLALKKSFFNAAPDSNIDDYNIAKTDVITPDIYQSWQRSFDQGIFIDEQVDDCPVQASHLTDALEQSRTIIDLSTPEINKLYQLIKGAGNIVLLADKNGVILDRLGDPDFVNRASKILLTKGAKWGESDKGTNAIGTAIKENKAIAIHGAEHYLNAHSFLTCASVPIHNPYGDILGVLDITGDYRGGNPHTLALINMSVEHIENEMFNHHFHQDIIVELFNTQSQTNWFEKNILVFDFGGNLVAANKCSMSQFNLTRQSLNHKIFEDIFDQKINGLIDHIILSNSQPYPLNHISGTAFYARAKTSYARLRGFSNQAKPLIPLNNVAVENKITFKHVDLGDSQMANNIIKIKKIMMHDIPLLLQGETGTGKGWLAKAIHHESDRSKQPFIAINCASLPKDLIESELFGYEGGAFTGANAKGHKGKLLAANGGYLFLDEIGDMPLELQTRLLRALEEKQINPIGSNQNIDIDINIISASNVDLRQAVENGTFRRDLYYRLNGFTVKLPKLNEREDFESLVQAILQREMPQADIILSTDVWMMFKQHTWQGNIRQLHLTLKVAALICDDNVIKMTDLPKDFLDEFNQVETKVDKLLSLEDGEKAVIANMLEVCNHNLSKTAKNLNISRNTLYSKMRLYSL